MENFTLENITFDELQKFMLANSINQSEKFTVTFNFDNQDLELKKEIAESPFIDFTQLPAFGMWADRDDMRDSTEYMKKLRKQKALQAIESFRGAGKGGSVEALLADRKIDREKDW